MYCTNCGKKLLEDANFCSGCGHKRASDILEQSHLGTKTSNDKAQTLKSILNKDKILESESCSKPESGNKVVEFNWNFGSIIVLDTDRIYVKPPKTWFKKILLGNLNLNFPVIYYKDIKNIIYKPAGTILAGKITFILKNSNAINYRLESEDIKDERNETASKIVKILNSKIGVSPDEDSTDGGENCRAESSAWTVVTTNIANPATFKVESRSTLERLVSGVKANKIGYLVLLVVIVLIIFEVAVQTSATSYENLPASTKGEICRLASIISLQDENKRNSYSFERMQDGYPIIRGARGWYYKCKVEGDRVFVTGKHPASGWRTGSEDYVWKRDVRKWGEITYKLTEYQLTVKYTGSLGTKIIGSTSYK